MAHQITRRLVERWLTDHGFEKLQVGGTGHINYSDGRFKITLSAHGRSELTRKTVGIIVRELERAGYPKRQVLSEFRGGWS